MMFQRKTKRGKETWTKKALQHVNEHTYDVKTNRLPKPLFCDPSICRAYVKPTCYTMIQPQYNVYRNFKKSLMVPGSVPPGWTVELSWLDVGGVSKAESEKRNYLDKKIIFVSDSNTTSPIDFLLQPKAKDSFLWLCQVYCDERLLYLEMFVKYVF